MIVPAPAKRPSKPPANTRAKRAVKASSPSSQPFLRFYYSESLRAKTLAVLTTLEKAKDGTKHRDALADVAVQLTDAGMEYYFLRPLKLAKVGFFVQQSANLGMSATTGVLISSAAWMALNFSRCVAIFGSSWSESRPPNTTFPPSPLAGLLGRTGRSRRDRKSTRL